MFPDIGFCVFNEMGTDSSLSNANQTSVLICFFDLGLHKGAQIIRTETCRRFLGVTINHWNTAKNQPKKSSSLRAFCCKESKKTLKIGVD